MSLFEWAGSVRETGYPGWSCWYIHAWNEQNVGLGLGGSRQGGNGTHTKGAR